MLSIEELLKFTEGRLSETRNKGIQQIIIEHPFYFEVIGDLNQMKKDLGSSKQVLDYLAAKKKAPIF